MSSKIATPPSKQTMASEPQETNSSIPKMIEPISLVPPSKPKKKTPIKSASKKKKPSKSKKGESKTVLSMDDLYEKENPFFSTVVEPSVGTSEKDQKPTDVEATLKITADVASSEVEKVNPNKTPNCDVSRSERKLGLEDLNAAIDSTKHMDIDNPNLDEENVVNDFIQASPKKSDDRKDVGLDVGASLDQQDKLDESAGTPVEDESGFKTASEKEVSFDGTAVCWNKIRLTNITLRVGKIVETKNV